MDGIPLGLTSIVPVLHDQSVITNRSGMNKPPVEIMPLPTDSFKSDDTETTEPRNDSFTLNLNKDGHGSSAAGGGKTVDRKAGALLTGAGLEEAYTLSLGNEETVPVDPEIAREMTRAKDYETLGKNAARHTYRKNQETMPETPADAVDPEPADAAGMKPPTQTVMKPALDDMGQKLSVLSNLAGIRLSATDIEAVLALEPELQEVFLNMLASVNKDGTAAPEDITAFMNKTIPAQLQPGGSIANLRKIYELPYSLYVFGHINAERKDDTDEDAAFDASKAQGAERKQTGGYLRLSEAVKMAAVLHSIYYGGSGQFPEETPWYAPYVRYAIKNGIIENGEFDNYNEYATRAETAYIFSNCVPKAELPILNHITDIPDVIENAGYGHAVYRLFRAGVLKKSGGNPNFYPESRITKAEAATIIGRIATPGDRKLIEK